jgi:outer membrane protein TolC
MGDTVSVQELSARLREQNPQLRRFDQRAARAEAVLRLAGQEYFPDITVGIQYIDTDAAHQDVVEDSGKDPLVATLSINLPIRFGAYRAAKEKARYQHGATLAEMADLESRLLASLHGALADLEDARRRVALYRGKLIPLAEQSREVTLRAFSAGTVGFTELIDSHSSLLRMRLALERALADLGQGTARIEMLIGGKPDGFSREAAPAEQRGGLKWNG